MHTHLDTEGLKDEEGRGPRLIEPIRYRLNRYRGNTKKTLMKKIGDCVSNKTACNDSGEGKGIKELALA